MGVLPNYTHKDPEIREIFNDLRFRMALSHAINREEISENIFLGLTEPFVAAAGSLWTGYEEGMGEKYSEYDVAKANALLDEMGLEWDEAEEVRLTPSGEPLSLLLEWETEWHAYSEDWLDLITLYWEEIGIDVETKFTSEEALQTRFVANEIDMTNVTAAGGSEVVARANYPIRLMPPWHWGSTSCCPGSAYPWRRWLDTGGDEGIEPPDDVKRIYDLVQQWLNTPYGTEEYESLINEVIRINVDNLYFIGSVTAPPRIMVITNRMANVPREDGVWGSEVFSPYLIEQFYISE
jgi:peptide/nickel transport system substrate-binding protein